MRLCGNPPSWWWRDSASPVKRTKWGRQCPVYWQDGSRELLTLHEKWSGDATEEKEWKEEEKPSCCFYKWLRHLRKSCCVSLAPTQRGYRWRLFLGTSIRQRLRGAAAPESASVMCPFDTGPQPTPIIHCSRGGEEQRAPAPSQLKHLINQFYLKRLALPGWQKACSRSALPFFWSCPVALTLSFHTANICPESNAQEKKCIGMREC